MASQCEITTFEELQNVSQEQLKKLSSDKVIAISLKALKDYGNVVLVLNYWAKKLLRIFHFAEISVDNIRKLFSAFTEQTAKVVDSATIKLFTKESFELLISVLRSWHDTASRINVKDARLKKASILIECSLQVLCRYYSFLKHKKNFADGVGTCMASELSELFDESQNFQKLLLSLILDNFDLFTCKQSSDVDDVIKLIDCLSAVGEIVPLLDVKLTAEVWKFLSKFTSENSVFMKYMSSEGCPNTWLRRPVKFLCEEIRNSVLAIYQQVPDQQPTDKVERILKINSFYLKLLNKFGSDFEHNYFTGCSEVVHTAVILIVTPNSFAGSKVESLIKQYLTVGFMNLFSLIYKNKEFVQALCNEPISSITNFEGLLLILLEILKLLIVEEDESVLRLYSASKSIIEKLFNEIPNYPAVLLKKDNYEALVTVISGLVLSKYHKFDIIEQFENILMNGILQNDFILASVCIDAWLCISRFVNSESRYRYFWFWVNCCLRFPLFSREPRAIYVQNLTRNLYDFLSSSYKGKFWHTILTSEKNNRSIISVLGIDRIQDVKQRENLRTHMLASLYELIQKNLKEITKEEYYLLVTNIKMLSNTLITTDMRLQEIIINFLSELLQRCNNKEKHTLIIISLLEFVSKHINHFSSNQRTILANVIDHNISSMSATVVKLHVVKFLVEALKIDKSEIYDKLTAKYQNESNKIVVMFRQIHSNINNHAPSVKVSLNETDVVNCLYKTPHCTFRHKCKQASKEELQRTKRMKFDEENPLLRNMLDNAHKVVDIFKRTKPSVPDIKLVNEILNIFTEISNNYNKS